MIIGYRHSKVYTKNRPYPPGSRFGDRADRPQVRLVDWTEVRFVDRVGRVDRPGPFS